MNAPRYGMQRNAVTQVVPDVHAGFWHREDFENLLALNAAVNGTGTNAALASVSGHPGMLRQGVTAAATPDRASYNFEQTNATLLATGGKVVFEWCGRLPTLSDGVNNLTARIGWANNVNVQVDFTDGIYFECDFANHANTNNWFACCAKAGTRTKVDTAKAPLANTFTKLKWTLSADGLSVGFSVDGIAVATVASNIPIVALMSGAQLVKQLGAGVLNLDHDFVEYTQTFNTQR
jgi:hypothetical protein